MTNPQVIVKSIILPCLLIIALGGSDAWSQGATGGSLGNDSKSLSGSAPEPRAAPARPERREAAPRRGGGESGGGAARFDGVWVVIAVGQSSVCAGQGSSNTVTVSGGRITGPNVHNGSVSASGVVHAIGGSSGLTNATDGRLSGRAGGGTFRQSDGCTGRWTAAKQ